MPPPAPGLFSTTTVHRCCFSIPVATARAMTLVPPPAPYPTTKRIGLLGKPAGHVAAAAGDRSSSAEAALVRTMRQGKLGDVLMCDLSGKAMPTLPVAAPAASRRLCNFAHRNSSRRRLHGSGPALQPGRIEHRPRSSRGNGPGDACSEASPRRVVDRRSRLPGAAGPGADLDPRTWIRRPKSKDLDPRKRANPVIDADPGFEGLRAVPVHVLRRRRVDGGASELDRLRDAKACRQHG